jgi:hypothetical protein
MVVDGCSGLEMAVGSISPAPKSIPSIIHMSVRTTYRNKVQSDKRFSHIQRELKRLHETCVYRDIPPASVLAAQEKSVTSPPLKHSNKHFRIRETN